VDADDHTLDGTVRLFLAALEMRRYSAALITRAGRVLPRLAVALARQGVSDVRAVNEAHLVAFARELAASRTRYGRSPEPSTQHAYLAVVCRYFAFLERRGLVLRDPSSAIVLPKPHALPRVVLSVAQARRLVTAPARPNPRWWAEAVAIRDRAILELLYGVGLRLGECLRLETADLDLFEGRLWVRNGKGRKDRVVPFSGRAAAALDAYLRTSRPLLARDPRVNALFLECQRGRALSRSALVVLLRTKARAAGLAVRVSAHVLRHSCATHLLKGGAQVRHVQELLGHASIESTALYTRVAVADLASTIARAHPRERSSPPERPRG
jgi:integrase/recombinase XerD